MLRTNLIGRFEQVDSYAPGDQIKFGNLNYIADIRGDLVFDGFASSNTTPCPRQEDSSDPLLDPVQGSTLIPTPTLDPERVTSSEDGSVSPAGLLPLMELPTEDPDAILDLPLENHSKLSSLRSLDSIRCPMPNSSLQIHSFWSSFRS